MRLSARVNNNAALLAGLECANRIGEQRARNHCIADGNGGTICNTYYRATRTPGKRHHKQNENGGGKSHGVVMWQDRPVTQAQRPGPRDATRATGARWPSSLQRLVRTPLWIQT